MKRLFSLIRYNYQDIYKASLFISAIILLLFIFPRTGKFKYEFSKGSPWLHDDLYAPIDFAIIKSDGEIENEKNELLKDLKPYFVFHEDIVNSNYQKLNDKFEKRWDTNIPDSLRSETYKKKNKDVILGIFSDLYERGILKPDVLPEEKDGDYQIILIRNNIAEETTFISLFTIQTANEYIYSSLDNYDNIENKFLASLLFDILDYNIIYDANKTQEEKESLLSDVLPTRGLIQTGEKIISKGELVNNKNYQVLQSLKVSYEERLGSARNYYPILIGQIILVSIIMIVLAMFLVYFRRDIYSDNKKIVLILLLLLLMVFITSLVIKYNVSFLYLVPICIVPVIIRAFFDTRLALYVHLIIVIMIGFLVPNSFEFVFLQMITGIIAIMSVAHLYRRSQFFLTSVWIFITYTALYIGLTLIQEGHLREINLVYFALFAGSAVLTLFSYPLIYIFERLFGFITDVTLIELSNTNNRLLRELSLKTPGTFQHSLQVANLAEEAIFEIGGNPLLVRTGALYHDIGKMDMPLYFIENQITGVNPHDELTYEESAKIIISHVIKGIEKAKKYKLPEQIIDFIRTHHGTRKVEYFYIMEVRENPGENVDEKEFTYHGPIPFSKETAVLMMADSVEAASRSLKDYNEDKIDKLVDEIIDKQLETGQFENSDITLKEITKIKSIFKKKLMTIYHIRIEYPE